jgi:cysteine synthase B
MGTTGTLMGAYKYFKEKKPQVRVVGVEPPKDTQSRGSRT